MFKRSDLMFADAAYVVSSCHSEPGPGQTSGVFRLDEAIWE